MNYDNFQAITPTELFLQNRIRELERKLYIYETTDRHAHGKEPVTLSTDKRLLLAPTITLALTAELTANVTRQGALSVCVRGRSGSHVVKGMYQEEVWGHNAEEAVRHAALVHETFVHDLADILKNGNV